ncbi:MAG TPA: HTTM domain-containing protein [Pirellula sp.]|nr:HTTM domain-containing protein [Pirellula sp.]
MKPLAPLHAGSGEDVSEATFFQSLLEFFFRPSAAHSLALIRIATGSMIAYIHLIWMLNLESFMGQFALINNSTWRALHQGTVPDYKWTYLAQTESMSILWSHEILACLSGLMLGIGFLSRAFSVLAWFTTLMTAHRMTGMLFGLDQITLMLAMYLCLARSGSVWSVDSWLYLRFRHVYSKHAWLRAVTGTPNGTCASTITECWSNTFATRLMQLHLCVIYFFGGLGKLRGEMWWDGSAMWYSIASYEYQSMDMTWIGHFPIMCSILTHLTVFWEVSYGAIIWPRWTRTWTLIIALLVHGGIALFLGMITFGVMMIVANVAFVSPVLVQHLVGHLLAKKPETSAPQGLRDSKKPQT